MDTTQTSANNKVEKKIEYVVLAFIILVVAVVSVWNGSRKEGFHVDEVYSYGLSNSNFLPFPKEGDTGAYSINDFMQDYGAGDSLSDLFKNISKDICIIKEAGFRLTETEIYAKYREAQYNNNLPYEPTTWHSGEYYKNYLIVEEGTGFNPISVYYNQRADVHPPFYYLLLNFVSSLFEGSFSKWYGFTVNFIALMASLLLLFKMVKTYIQPAWIAYATVFVYGLSMGFQSTMVFFRMYGVVTLLTIALCYFHLYLQKHNWTLGHKQKLALITLIVLGYYTLYYFVIYAAILMLLAIVLMAKSGQAKKIWTYIRQYIYAAAIGIVIWPFSLKHFFSDYRGDDFRSALQSVQNYGRAIIEMFKELARTCMGNNAVLLLVLILLAITAAVLCVVYRKETKDVYWLVFLPPFAHFFCVSISAPMIHNRYVMNIMPFLFLAIMIMIAFYTNLLLKKREIKVAVCTLFVAVMFLFSNCFMHKPDHLKMMGNWQWKYRKIQYVFM